MAEKCTIAIDCLLEVFKKTDLRLFKSIFILAIVGENPLCLFDSQRFKTIAEYCQGQQQMTCTSACLEP
jgi:hypothetical protein